MSALNILHLEDSEVDHELLVNMLDGALTANVRRVDSESSFAAAIKSEGIDLIISDFTLPGFSGSRALDLARATCPEVPFVFFSGTIGEEAAVEALRSGATDYILKHRPAKMIAAIDRILREKKERESRKNAEMALQRREEEFRCLIENALDVISIINPLAQFTYNSPSIESVLGFTPTELLNRDAFSLIHPDDLQKAKATFARCLDQPGILTSVDLRLSHKDGSWRDLEVIGKSLPKGSVIEGVVINARDVTEKRLTEAQLLRAQRMECVGVIAGGLAHDLNNILSPIMLGSELLKECIQDSDGLNILDTIRASSQRGSDIVKQVLSFARGVKGDASMLDIKPLISEVLKLLRETFPKSIEFQKHFSPEPLTVLCNPTELHQVIMNLCVNARDAMPDGGLLQIKAVEATVAEAQALSHHVEPGHFVRITVADTGIGIPKEILPQIFEPFFTTKEEGKGTGLGLPTVLSIVQRNGGFLEVNSVSGEGTQFDVYLRSAAPVPIADNKSSVIARGEGERILLVDDEVAILEMGRIVLENFNYTVEVASEGLQALRKINAQPDTWRLVITDASMPVMDGPTLIGELRRIRSELPVICTTGQISSDHRARLLKSGASLVMDKPYTTEQLLSAVSTVLRRRD